MFPALQFPFLQWILKNGFHPEKNLKYGQFMKTKTMKNNMSFPI